MILKSDQLKSILPNAGYRADDYLPHLNLTIKRYGIDNVLRLSAFLAQIGYESGSFRYVEEIASGEAYSDRSDLGNTSLYAIQAAKKRGFEVGPFYKGHGLIQITGYQNHQLCGMALELDLVNWPELLMIPKYAALSAGWFWFKRGLNILADKKDFEEITRRINGGLNGYSERLIIYKRAKKILEV